jgi:hypothetical protein
MVTHLQKIIECVLGHKVGEPYLQMSNIWTRKGTLCFQLKPHQIADAEDKLGTSFPTWTFGAMGTTFFCFNVTFTLKDVLDMLGELPW